MILQTNMNLQGSTRSAEIELDFGSKTWNLKNGKIQLPGVGYSDQGPFQVQPSGVIWLLDGPGNSQTRTTMIIWDAPRNENDTGHASGNGRLYEPANTTLKDGPISWKFLRRSAPATPAVPTLSPIRQAMMAVLRENVPQKTISSDDPLFKKLTGYNTQMLLDNFWEPENKQPPWPAGKMPKKNLSFTTCNLTLGCLAGKLGQKLGKRVGRWLGAGVLQLDWAAKDVPGSWIPSSTGGSPRAGDFYSVADGAQVFGHVGTIGEINPDGTFCSVDGGQGGYRSANKKDFIKWKNRGKLEPSRMNGWVDIDKYFA